MRITIRYTSDCPHADEAERRVREALRSIGAGAEIDRELVGNGSEAERLFFAGSPTILIDGIDPFAGVGGPSPLACRIYATEEGHEGSPSVSQLVEVLQAAG